MALEVVSSAPKGTLDGSIFWVGQDGNVYMKGAGGDSASVQNLGTPQQARTWDLILNGAVQVDDPNPGGGTSVGNTTTTTGGGGGTTDAEAARLAQEEARRGQLRGEISGLADDVESVYGGLFGDLNNLILARDQELEAQYGDQFKKAGEQYAGAIPEIETSYAAIGAGDSTDNTYAKNKAKKGFDDTTETIGKNKESDKAKLGQYKTEQEAELTKGRDSARSAIAGAQSSTDISGLEATKRDIEGNVNTGKTTTKASYGTEGAAKKTLTDLTKDGGRYEAAVTALDSILQSSLSGSVKEAAVKAITDNAGLSDEEKDKINVQYGNVYAEQQAL